MISKKSDKKGILREKPEMLTAHQSNETLINIKVDPDVMAKHEEEQEVLKALGEQSLPGTVKTKWALGFKMNMD